MAKCRKYVGYITDNLYDRYKCVAHTMGDVSVSAVMRYVLEMSIDAMEERADVMLDDVLPFEPTD